MKRSIKCRSESRVQWRRCSGCLTSGSTGPFVMHVKRVELTGHFLGGRKKEMKKNKITSR